MGSLSEAMALRAGRARTDAKGIAQGGGSGVSSMVGDARFQIDATSFNAAMQRIYRETNRSAQETVRYGMILMLTGGRAATPKGQKKRKIENTGDGLGDFFRVFYQPPVGMKIEHLPWVQKTSGMTTAQQQKNWMIRAAMIKAFTNIERVGLAKASWGWALKKFCGTGSDTLPGKGYRNDPIDGFKAPLNITVENKLGWINHLVPGIERLMIQRAEKKMIYRLENGLTAAMNRAGRAA